jgi:hypothetical protein
VSADRAAHNAEVQIAIANALHAADMAAATASQVRGALGGQEWQVAPMSVKPSMPAHEKFSGEKLGYLPKWLLSIERWTRMQFVQCRAMRTWLLPT